MLQSLATQVWKHFGSPLGSQVDRYGDRIDRQRILPLILMCVCMQSCVQPYSGLPHCISMGQPQRVVQLTEPPYAQMVT